MNKLYFLLFAAALVLLASQANGAEWVEIGSDGAGNRYWYDRATVQELQKDTIELWIKTAYSDQGRKIKIESMMRAGLDAKDYEALDNTKALLEINCAREEMRILRVDHYSNGVLIPGGSWSVILKPSEGWEAILPGMVGTGLLRAVCAPKSVK